MLQISTYSKAAPAFSCVPLNFATNKLEFVDQLDHAQLKERRSLTDFI